MTKIRQTKMYEAPMTELIEISPVAVLCESAPAPEPTNGNLFRFGDGERGTWN